MPSSEIQFHSPNFKLMDFHKIFPYEHVSLNLTATVKGSGDMVYIIDLSQLTCDCPSFTKKTFGMGKKLDGCCKHLDTILKLNENDMGKIECDSRYCQDPTIKENMYLFRFIQLFQRHKMNVEKMNYYELKELCDKITCEIAGVNDNYK